MPAPGTTQVAKRGPTETQTVQVSSLFMTPFRVSSLLAGEASENPNHPNYPNPLLRLGTLGNRIHLVGLGMLRGAAGRRGRARLIGCVKIAAILRGSGGGRAKAVAWWAP